MLNSHCSLCCFLGVEGICFRHFETSSPTSSPSPPPSAARAAAPEAAPSIASDSSFYTARTTESRRSSISSTSTLRASVYSFGWDSLTPRRMPSLRRTSTPTCTTLRELNTKHSHHTLVRQMESDECLRQLYEMQTDEYLNSPVAGVDLLSDDDGGYF